MYSIREMKRRDKDNVWAVMTMPLVILGAAAIANCRMKLVTSMNGDCRFQHLYHHIDLIEMQ